MRARQAIDGLISLAFGRKTHGEGRLKIQCAISFMFISPYSLTQRISAGQKRPFVC